MRVRDQDAPKAEMLKRDQVRATYSYTITHAPHMWQVQVRAERDVLVESTSPCVGQLYYSFRGSLYPYLNMEFLPCRRLMTAHMKYDVFFGDVTRSSILVPIVFVCPQAVRCSPGNVYK